MPMILEFEHLTNIPYKKSFITLSILVWLNFDILQAFELGVLLYLCGCGEKFETYD